jgi:glycosyltransferase involved in cell wall biosynthesis
MPSISVLILTLNEEANLEECLESCSWSDDVVVLDSFSSDRTREIAARRPVRFFERTFDNYAAQRNAGLTEIQYKHSWVLMVDADERTPRDLADELQRRVVEADGDTVLFYMRRKDFFLGRWLRRSSGYPTWFGRLMRVGRVRVEREVNEQFIADGKTAYLQAHLHHYPFNKGIAHWVERHNRYSTMEALAKMQVSRTPLRVASLLSSSPVERRRALKHLAYRLPMRPGLLFFYWYVFRLGFLDGRAGLAFSMMRATYEFLIDLKVMEAQRRRSGTPV